MAGSARLKARDEQESPPLPRRLAADSAHRTKMNGQTAGPSRSMDMDVDHVVQTTTTITQSEQVIVNTNAQTNHSPPVKRLIPRATIGYVYDDRMMMHAARNGHTEAPERISRVYEILEKNGCIDVMEQLPIREAEREEILLVHSEGLWEKVLAISDMSEQDIIDSEQYYEDLSLYVHPKTPLAARLSCGGVIEATLAVARGVVQKSFAIVRPPGHHSEPDEHMGFCFFNNVSIAIRILQQLTPIKKVLILDWDVHHGNGTQRAFNDDPSVLYISLHRYDGGQFYPCGPFGSMISCGEGKGLGYSVNIPWPEKGMGDADYIHAFQQIVMPIAMEFAPELVVVSAGFDAADGDELGECHVTPAGYAHMTHMLSALAGGKMVVALEGGYNIDALATSSLAVAKILLGEAPPEMPPLVASQIGAETVWQVAMEQSKYWKSVNPKSCEPREDVKDLTFTIPELLRAHRQEYLFREHDMLMVPFASLELEAKYKSLVTCTADVMENQTLIVFVHEFGNIRTEFESIATCDLSMEQSYLIDFSKQNISHVRSTKHALLDVNLYPRQAGRGGKSSADVMTYLWDNYIQLTSARRVVLIGHGPGCEAVMQLIENRAVGVMKIVKGVVQVVGTYNVPSVPRDTRDLREWYYTHSCVVVPEIHPLLREQKQFKRHGLIMSIDEQKPIKIIMKAFPMITQFIDKMLLVGRPSM